MSKKMVEKLKDELKKNPINEDYYDVSVTYIQGDNSSDIVNAIIQTYGEDRIHFAKYDALFADYEGEPVTVFSNFDSSVPLSYMADLLDTFPIVPTRHDWKTFCSERIFIISYIPLDEHYPEYLHDTSPHASWARFSNSFDSVLVCRDDSVQSFSNITAYRAETQLREVRQSYREELKEAITEYQPQNYPPHRHRGWRIMHMFIQIFGLYIQDTSGCKSSLSRYDERYRVVDRDGNIVLDNVSLEYLNGLLDYMYFD